MDILRDLWGPGLIFLVLCIWLVRKAIKAARNESDLEGERLAGTLAEELQRGRDVARASQRPQLAAVPLPDLVLPEEPADATAPPAAVPTNASPAEAAGVAARAALGDADTAAATAEHVALVTSLIAEREGALHAVGPARARACIQVLWVRSASGHVAWCERRHAAPAEATLVRDVLCVARVENGKLSQRWTFG